MACTRGLVSKTNIFCLRCKAPRPLDWTTGNKSLDSFIMESWSNTISNDNAYIQWIEYSLLTNVRKKTELCLGCPHWFDSRINKWTKVTLKQISDTLSFDFHLVSYFMCKIMQIVSMFSDSCCNGHIFFYSK